MQADACWFVRGTPEYNVTKAIGYQLEMYGHWRISDIREEFALSSPHRHPTRCVILYPDGRVVSSLNSSNETAALIARANNRYNPPAGERLDK